MSFSNRINSTLGLMHVLITWEQQSQSGYSIWINS